MKSMRVLVIRLMLSGALTISFSAYGSETPKLTMVENYCISYTLSGSMMNGTEEKCFRKWGAESYTKSETKIGFGGFSKKDKKHNINMGGKIYNIDPDKMTGTVMDNPVNEIIEQSDTEDIAQAVFDSLGYTATGESKRIADTECVVYTSSMTGTACFTDQFIMLELSVMGTHQVATWFSTDESGNEADYLLWQHAEITQAPDLQDIMSQFNGNNN